MAKIPFALQLYSVRDALEEDIAGTLERVKKAGYDHVELCGTAGKSVEEFRAALATAELTAISCHVDFDRCQSDLAGAIADCQAFGVKWAVIPWLDPEAHTQLADWSARGGEMAAMGEAFKAAGITLCFHNHFVEFEPIDGKTPFDAVFEAADPAKLSIELDVGWSHYGGADTLAVMQRYDGRIPLLHIKDIKQRYDGEEPHITELGNGATKFGPLLKAAGEIGVAWLIVEQDESARDPLESARMNAAYMRVHVF